MFLRSGLLMSEGEPLGGEPGGDLDGGDPGAQPGQSKEYNEVRKTQRLLRKQQEENGQLRQRLDSILPQFEKMSRFMTAFEGGESQEGQEQPDRGASLYERAREAHERLKAQNPESNGIGITLESAELIKQLMEENKSLKGKFGDFEKKAEQMNNPMFFAEQTFAVSAAASLRQELEQIYGEKSAADENYPDFERTAIARLRAMKEKGGADYLNLLRDPPTLNRFVREIVTSKFPKAYNTREGFRKLDDYSMDDAKRDMDLVQTGKVKDPREASRLQAKARQRMLSSMAEHLLQRGN